MPDANSQDLQVELALLREQIESQLAEHRLEVAAALERIFGTVVSNDVVGEMQARVREWERRETELSEKIAARTVEYQALRASTEFDRYRLEMQVADLEKQLALRDAESAKLKSILEALMAEHAECCRNPAAAQASPGHERVRELEEQLEASRLEIAALRNSIDSSVALKLARSLSWLLSPVRSLLPKPPAPPGAGS
jgi:hypothetical protein